MADELDVIALKKDRPDLGLKAGQRGTIVLKHDERNFLVEFSDSDGVEYAMPTLTAEEVEVVWRIADHLEGQAERRAAG
ncbi:DUF4926 domain-containing protein [Brevundimonas sp.]|uniref:DUF4926 domain-containing protein n=1 Tax=Brevundimonas sp. TaxID=1871086 RepID=UPI003F710817